MFIAEINLHKIIGLLGALMIICVDGDSVYETEKEKENTTIPLEKIKTEF